MNNPLKTWQFWLGVAITVVAVVIIYKLMNQMPSKEDIRQYFPSTKQQQEEPYVIYPDIVREEEHQSQQRVRHSHAPSKPTTVPPGFVILSSRDGTPVAPETSFDLTPTLPPGFEQDTIKDDSKDSKGERESRRVLQSIFNVPFNKARPEWFYNDMEKNGKRNPMELDGLYLGRFTFRYKDIVVDYEGIAFEYQGAQHYQADHYWNKSYQDFVEQVYRDQRKVALCDYYGIYLFTIPYNVRIQDIEAYIKYYMPDQVIKRQIESER